MEIRSLHGWSEREAAVELYRATFGLADTDPAMTPKLVAALQHNGGSAVGAFEAHGRLVGFAYGFLGVDRAGGRPYHYSQAAVVADSHQGRGIGRRLKLAQADVARATGVDTMRWAYDPVQARNAHFNLDVLGARGRWFYRNYYDRDDAAGRTDRVVVEWDLTADAETSRSTAAPPALDPADVDGAEFGEPVELAADRRALVIPADWSRVTDPTTLRNRVADALEALLPAGWTLVSCRRLDPDRAAYTLVRGPVDAELSP